MQEKGQGERFSFHIIIYGRKTIFFVESSDSDIRKLVGMFFQKLQRRQQIRTRKLALKYAEYFGALQKFNLHHNLPSFDLITVDI